jgi:hypothetical protein
MRELFGPADQAVDCDLAPVDATGPRWVEDDALSQAQPESDFFA